MRREVKVLGGALFVTIAIVSACVDDAKLTTGSPDASVLEDASVGAYDATVPDGAGKPDADAPFTPQALGPRLVLWLEAESYGASNGVMEWVDKSGAGNNAWQDASARSPFIVDGGADGSVNGHGVVRFAGNEFLSIADNATLQWGTSDFGLYVVMRHTNDGATQLPPYGIVYGKWTDVGPSFPGFFLWANYPASTGYVTRLDTQQVVASDGGMNDGVARLVSTRRKGGDYELRIGGVQVAAIADAGIPDADAFNAPGLDAVIGGRPSPVQQLHGDIAEIIAVKGTLSDAEQSAIEGYLKAKFGL